MKDTPLPTDTPPTVKPRKGFNLSALTKTSPFQPAPEPIPGTEPTPPLDASATTRAQMLARRTSLTRIAAHLGFEKPEYLAVLLNLFDVCHKRNLDERADAMTELRNHLAEIAEMGGIPQ